MECRKGESENRAKPGRYRCRTCGAASKKKDHLCKPKKIKGEKSGSLCAECGSHCI